MAYYDVAMLASDGDFASRCMACYASEQAAVATPNPVSEAAAPSPAAWWSDHNWQLAAQPGFGEAYASALVSDSANPGRDQAVISDAQILAAVQSLPKETPA